MTSEAKVAFARLEGALRAVGDALGHADLERLLSVEPELAAALEAAAQAEPGVENGDVQATIETTRATLLRCRRLGAALVEFTRISLDPSGEAGYSRAGMLPAFDRPGVAGAVVPGPTLEARG